MPDADYAPGRPRTLSGVSERIEEVRCSEVLNYATYNQPMVLFDIMGFGSSMDEVPFILTPGVLPMRLRPPTSIRARKPKIK